MDKIKIFTDEKEDDLNNNTLYKIKELKFDVEEIKNNLGLEIMISKKYDEDHQIVIYKDKSYEFYPPSRIIQFIDGENVIEKFIYSKNNLAETLNELNFKSFTVDGKVKSFDLFESEIGKKEINRIFKDKSIIKIIKITSELENIMNKFKKRFPKNHQVRYISDLSLNSSSYYPENKNDEINFHILVNYYRIFADFFVDYRNILYFVGPKGTSKSICLLNYCFEFYFTKNIPLLYINYKEIIKLTPDQKKNLIENEMIYLFFEEKDLEYFYKSKPFENIKKVSLVKFIFDFITKLLNIFENTFKKFILIVIDNFDEDDEYEVQNLKNIINLAKKSENSDKIKLIISGRCKFIYKIQNLYLNNNLDYKEKLFYYNIELNKNRDMNSLPFFYFNKNTKEEILEKEINFCDKFNLHGIYYSLLQNGREIKLYELNRNYNILPIDYLVFNINKDKDIITFQFHNEIYKTAVKEKIKTEIEINTIDNLLKKLNYSQITHLIFEEKLLTLFFSYNKLNIENLYFKEENRVEVEEIYEFQNSKFNKTNKKIDPDFPIIVTQENYLGKNYDLLILKPTLNISYIAYFIKIGTVITKNQIETNEIDLSENRENYKSGIEKFIGFHIPIVKLMFIFDKETQINKIITNKFDNDNCFSCLENCLNNYISFYLFSTKDYSLYSTSRSNIEYFEKVKNFAEEKFVQKRTYNSTFKSNINLMFSPDEIYSLNEITNDNICKNYTLSIKQFEIEENIDTNINFNINSIYVFQNGRDKIFVIKGIYYFMENNKLKDIKDNETIEKFKYKYIIILEKLIGIEDMPIYKFRPTFKSC